MTPGKREQPRAEWWLAINDLDCGPDVLTCASVDTCERHVRAFTAVQAALDAREAAILKKVTGLFSRASTMSVVDDMCRRLEHDIATAEKRAGRKP